MMLVVGAVLGLVQHALSGGRQQSKKGGWYGKDNATTDDDGSRYRRATDSPRWVGSELGIPLDGFLGTFETFVVGLGLVIGMAGLVGYVGSLVRCESAL